MTSSRTLSAQLRHRVTLIVAALAIILSASTLLAARTMTYNQVDAQLEAAFARQGRPGAPGDLAPGINVPGMAQGTVIVALLPSGEKRGTTVGDGQFLRVTTEAGDVLLGVPADGRKHTLSVPGMGEYRAEARIDSNLVVVALPLAEQNRTLFWLTVLSAGMGVLAVLVAAAATATACLQAGAGSGHEHRHTGASSAASNSFPSGTSGSVPRASSSAAPFVAASHRSTPSVAFASRYGSLITTVNGSIWLPLTSPTTCPSTIRKPSTWPSRKYASPRSRRPPSATPATAS